MTLPMIYQVVTLAITVLSSLAVVFNGRVTFRRIEKDDTGCFRGGGDYLASFRGPEVSAASLFVPTSTPGSTIKRS